MNNLNIFKLQIEIYKTDEILNKKESLQCECGINGVLGLFSEKFKLGGKFMPLFTYPRSSTARAVTDNCLSYSTAFQDFVRKFVPKTYLFFILNGYISSQSFTLNC